MKTFLSIILTFFLLLQNFVTVKAMPIQQDEKVNHCLIKKEQTQKHSCCKIQQKRTEKKGNCCSDTYKMSCCVNMVLFVPTEQSYSFKSLISISTPAYGYLESNSTYQYDIFHPPILNNFFLN